MLPRCQAAQVHRRESAYSHRADRVEERVDITDGILSIGSVKYSRCDQRDEGAVIEKLSTSTLVRICIAATYKKSR